MPALPFSSTTAVRRCHDALLPFSRVAAARPLPPYPASLFPTRRASSTTCAPTASTARLVRTTRHTAATVPEQETHVIIVCTAVEPLVVVVRAVAPPLAAHVTAASASLVAVVVSAAAAPLVANILRVEAVHLHAVARAAAPHLIAVAC